MVQGYIIISFSFLSSSCQQPQVYFYSNLITAKCQYLLWGSCLGIRVLVDAREKLHIPWGDPENQVHGETVMAFDTRSSLMAKGMVETKVFLNYLPAIRALWQDAGIQNAYDRRREFQLVNMK